MIFIVCFLLHITTICADTDQLQNKQVLDSVKEPSILVQQKSRNTKKVTVVNVITTEKTAYKHWTGTYEPEFSVTVEGQPINMSCKETVELNTTAISIAYHAQFPAQRSSEDTIIVQLEKNTKIVTIDFDWHSEPRLHVTQTP